jgi:hypothetical protein
MISEEDDPYGSEWMGKKGISGDERERNFRDERERGGSQYNGDLTSMSWSVSRLD